MYINKIDELIEKIIDSLYFLCLENKKFINILKESDYIKYQKEINDIMTEFYKTIDFTELKNSVKNKESLNKILETIKKYIIFYIFLVIGFFYNDKDSKYINNLVEFGKNQINYNYKIENFFSSESNALVLKFKTLIHHILILLNADQNKIKQLKNTPEYKETIEFLNSLGSEFINEKFKVQKKLKNYVYIQAHNIIKTIIIMLIYQTSDKKEFFQIIETTEIQDGESMFIDIVVPIKQTTDIVTIEKMLDIKQDRKTTALYLWKYFADINEQSLRPTIDIDKKITDLINSHLVIPICDDFLLYHKDSERYDQGIIEQLKYKKNEYTKIKYIVDKIDGIKEFYSDRLKNDIKKKSEIKKLFYMPMISRKAILINIYENVNIIIKFTNAKNISDENLTYLKDFEHYTLYPYINFDNFPSDGFPLQLTQTGNIVRGVSLEKTGDFRQTLPYKIIQTRIGSKDMTVNIIGFMIPSSVIPLQCIKIKNTIDIRSLTKNKNGLDLITQYLKESHFNTKKHMSSIYWLFNNELDSFIAKTYNHAQKFSSQENTKQIISELYDNIQNEILDYLINIFTKQKHITVQRGYQIIEYFKNKIMNIDNHIFYDLENEIFKTLPLMEPVYDKNSDLIYDDITNSKSTDIKFEDHKIQKNIISINVSSINKYGRLTEQDNKKENVIGLCQHNITKDKIEHINIKNFKRYSDELNKFIQQYVAIDVNENYICKSCGNRIEDLTQYIEDGEYDNETRTFVSYSLPLDTNIEDILGYEKYKIAIRQIDKTIEKIASVSNILYLVGSSTNVKPIRRLIVKNTIDLLLANTIKLKPSYQTRNTKITELYGINVNYTKLFVFDLDNNIFVYSSKDIDKRKPIKINTIIAYIIFFLLLEINETHIHFIGDDKKKICNITMFEKIEDQLFGNLKIIINWDGKIQRIMNYKILCYIIYIISCSIATKTKMWSYQSPSPENKKKNTMNIQKSIIHTVIDILNSILETKKDKNEFSIYNMNITKFFNKLQKIYSNNDLYNQLKKNTVSTTIATKKENELMDDKFIILSGKYSSIMYDIPRRTICNRITFSIPLIPQKKFKYYGISNLTNCPDGQFHQWIVDKRNLICKLCKTSSLNLKYDEKLSSTIRSNFINLVDQKLVASICNDCSRHIFVKTENETGNELCRKCKKERDYVYNATETQEIHEAVRRQNKDIWNNIIEHEDILNQESAKNQIDANDIIKKIYSEYTNNNSNDMKYINKLIDELQKITGEDYNNVNLVKNIYTIDHDNFGNIYDHPIKILESENKILEKMDHPYFQTNVLYYVNNKGKNKIEIYYDMYSKMLLGYKEENKHYVKTNVNRKIKITYSLVNKLKLLGYQSQFISVDEIYNELVGNRTNTIPQKILEGEITKYVTRKRIHQLQKILYNLQLIISRMANNYSGISIPDDYYKVKIDSLFDKYREKLRNLKKTNIFEHWKIIYNNINIENNDNIKTITLPKNKLIYYNDVNNIDTTGNIITYYIISELLKLLKLNDSNKSLKTTLSNFIIDFFNIIFDFVNEEKDNDIQDIKSFSYMVSSSSSIKEIQEQSGVRTIEGIVTEFVTSEKTKEELLEEQEEKFNLAEENQAYDIDVDNDDLIEDGDDVLRTYAYAFNLDD